jgi:hypothetical protein
MKQAILLLVCIAALVSFAGADPPVISGVQHFPYLTEVNTSTFIRANVTDVDGDLSGVYVDIALPNGTSRLNLPMSLLSGDTFQRVYTPDQRGTHQYRIHAVDLALNQPFTGWNDFFVVNFFTYSDEVLINVYVLASCCGMPSYFYVPDKVMQNQTVIFLYIFKNCGNVPLTSRINELKIVNMTDDIWFDRTGIGVPTGVMESEEEIFYWEIWSTVGVPLGNYTAIVQTNYSSTFESGNRTYANFTTFASTINCTPVVGGLSTCSKIDDRSCNLYPSSDILSVGAILPSAVIVPGMAPGSTTYFGGPSSINGTMYGTYIFNMTSCGEEYCYACLSTDFNLQSNECAYLTYPITLVNYEVTNISADGQNVNFTRMDQLCDYTMSTYVCRVFANGSAYCNYSRYCFGIVREERDFEIVSAMGETTQPEPTPQPQVGPYPLILREMPPQINQAATCSAVSPWATCTYTTNRLVLYNIGIADLSSARVLDNFTVGACYAPDCSPVAYRCVASADYTCRAFQSAGRYYVEFNLTAPLRPRHYKILEYEFVPARNTSIYSLGNESFYQFNSSVRFRDMSPRGGGANYTTYENDPYYNPPQSKRMRMRDVAAFNYDISVRSNGSWDRRDFFTDEATNFNLTVHSITGVGVAATAWTAAVGLSPFWAVSSCTPPVGYSCLISPSLLTLSGPSTPASMTSLLFRFTANVSMETFFLLPINKSLGGGRYEEYVPGLFLMSREIMQRNITQNQTINQTVPEPQPEPTPQPQPQEQEKEKEKEVQVEVEVEVPFNVTQPEAEMAIDIKPVEREINGSQGMFVAAVFNVTNIGNMEATNITLLPIVPEGWEYKTAFVSYLDVGERTNRTIFVKPPFTVSGKFAIPVKAIRGDLTLAIDYFWLDVIKAVNVTVLDILESPRTIRMAPNSNITVPILLKNIGKVRLHDVVGRLENAEQCIESYSFTSMPILDPQETRPSYLTLRSKSKPEKCPSTIIFSTREEAYAFSDTNIIITPPAPLIPEISNLNLLLLLMIFAGILWAARKGKEKNKLRKMTRQQRINTIVRYFIMSVIVAVVLYLSLGVFGAPLI